MARKSKDPTITPDKKARDEVLKDKGVADPDNDKSRPDTTMEAMIEDGLPVPTAPYIAPDQYRRTMKWSQNAEDEIIDRIMHGEALRNICQEEHLPSPATFLRWVEGELQFVVGDPKTLAKRYARAMQLRRELIVEDMFDIADDGSNDTMTVETRNGSFEQPDREWIARSKLRVEIRQWYLGKTEPSRWGEKIQVDANVEHSGTVNFTEQGLDFSKLSPAAQEKLHAFLTQVEEDKEAGIIDVEAIEVS